MYPQLRVVALAVPRRSTTKLFRMVDRSNNSSLMVFALDRKQIKSVRSFKSGELTEERIQAIVKEAEKAVDWEVRPNPSTLP